MDSLNLPSEILVRLQCTDQQIHPNLSAFETEEFMRKVKTKTKMEFLVIEKISFMKMKMEFLET